jgi:hypothetical protein
MVDTKLDWYWSLVVGIEAGIAATIPVASLQEREAPETLEG